MADGGDRNKRKPASVLLVHSTATQRSILERYKTFFGTSANQFGFKNYLAAPMPSTLRVRQSVDYYAKKLHHC